MILIFTTPAAAPEVAYALGDPILKSRRLWLSHATDVRAAKAAAALTGDSRAITLNINSFYLGALAGLAACLLWVTVFRVAHHYGQALYLRTHATFEQSDNTTPSMSAITRLRGSLTL